jgi:hypothetical protein
MAARLARRTLITMPPENQATAAPDRHRLRDGRMVTIRSVRPGDELDLLRFMTSQSASPRRLRLFTTARDLGTGAGRGELGDPSDWARLVALDTGQIAGHAVYVRTYGPRADVAFEVGDEMHELGLATLLISELARVANGRQIDRFVTEVLPEDNATLAVFRDAFDALAEWDEGVVYIDFPTGAWRCGEQLLRRRERPSVTAPTQPVGPPIATGQAGVATLDLAGRRC